MMIKHNYTGASLLQLREKYGLGAKGFWDNTWWLNEAFAKETPPKGEYEIDLGESLKNLTFSDQQAKLPKGFEVVHPAIITEAILTHFEKTGERLLGTSYARTSSLDSGDDRVDVGNFGADGLVVGDDWDDRRDDSLGLGSYKTIMVNKESVGDASIFPDVIELNGQKYKKV